MMARRIYPTVEAAQHRVDKLRLRGIWPGVVGPAAGGGYWLTFDWQDGGDA